MARAWAEPTAELRTSAIAGGRRAYWARVRRLARARLAPFLAYVLLLQVLNTMRTVAVIGFDSPLMGQAMWESAVGFPMLYVPIFAAIVLTEALALQGWRHFAASFVGLSAADGISVACVTLVLGHANPVLVGAHVIVSDDAFIWRMFWVQVGAGMLLVAYFAFREREQTAAKAAQAANTERANVERATTAARLKVMQARVEPELLFGALREVRDLYLNDSAAADALLDDLITYLRAALPQMRGDASTLGREAALAVAYATVLPAARRGELAAESAIPQDVQGMPFPPMVLLPMVRAAAESAVSRIVIAMEGESASGVEVRVEPAQRPAGWDEARLEAIRAALSHGFGTGATLHIDAGRAVVRWQT
jgi:hypothetical protein